MIYKIFVKFENFIVNLLFLVLFVVVFILPLRIVITNYLYSKSPQLTEDVLKKIKEFSRRQHLIIQVGSRDNNLFGDFTLSDVDIGIPYFDINDKRNTKTRKIRKVYKIKIKSIEYDYKMKWYFYHEIRMYQ